MSLITNCTCPITRTLVLSYTGSTPAPSSGYIVRWRSLADNVWNTITPNPTTSPVSIPNVPVCANVEVSIQSQCDNSQVSAAQTITVNKVTGYACNDVIEGFHTGTGYHVYPDYLLDVSGATDIVNLAYDVMDNPKRFRVYDSSGTTVADSGWRGVSPNPGLWGTSLNTALTGNLTFTRTNCFYRLVVEQVTETGNTDSFSVTITCPTGTTPVTPTVTYLSCTDGYGSYRISAPSGTNMKIRLAASGTLTNNSSGSYCARLEGTLVSSTGVSDTETSGVIQTTGSAAIGGTGSLFINVTIPGSGYLTLNTSLFSVNSSASGITGLFTIYEVNGVVQSSPVTQQVCAYGTTGVVSCAQTQYHQWTATRCADGLSYTIITDTDTINGVTVIPNQTYKTTVPSGIGECWTINSYDGLTSVMYGMSFYFIVPEGCGGLNCVNIPEPG